MTEIIAPKARINRALNLVIPVETDDHGMVYVYSTPISRDIFEAHFYVLAKTFSALFNGGLSVTSGPRVAFMMLRKIATDLGEWTGPGKTQDGLWNEIVRLTNVAVAGPNGYQQIPLDTIAARGILHADVLSEIENQLVFFTCVCKVASKAQAPDLMQTMADLWACAITPSSFTDYLSSLQTSKTEPPAPIQLDSQIPS